MNDEKKCLFQNGFFKLHSGNSSYWKVDCDALGEEDIRTIANVVQETIEYSSVVGIPSGGLRLAEELMNRPTTAGAPVLLVDDVLTTGNSMEEWRDKLLSAGVKDVIGFVIFARGEIPSWIQAFWKRG